MEKVYIYKLIDPITNEIRYVGKTINLKRRLRAHITRSKNKKHHTACWIQSLIKKGEHPIIEVIEECSEDNWQEREIYWIQEYRKLHDLTNLLNGGEGGATYGRLGTPWSEKQRINNRKARFGVSVKHTPEGDANRKKGIREYYNSIKKSVLQYDLDGNFIKKWDSAVDAGNGLNISPSNITRSCKSSNLTTNGFMWSYEGVTVTKQEKRTYGEKSIIQYDKDGIFLKEYNSLKSAYDETGIKQNAISNCLGNRSKTAGGYQWEYK